LILHQRVDLTVGASTIRAAFFLGAYASGVSGSHLNPGVTFALCVLRRFPWKKFPLYVIGQVLGAFCGALIVYGNYISAIDVYEGGAGIRTVPGYSETGTAGMFWSVPADFMTSTGQFFSEFIGSAIIMFSVLAIKDDRNPAAGALFPLGLFFIIFSVGIAFGWETGFAFNFARDFGPRLMTYCVGYGPEVWDIGMHFFWVSFYLSDWHDVLA
jgi:aquaglyceroporin related protein, other eukaryote